MSKATHSVTDWYCTACKRAGQVLMLKGIDCLSGARVVHLAHANDEKCLPATCNGPTNKGPRIAHRGDAAMCSTCDEFIPEADARGAGWAYATGPTGEPAWQCARCLVGEYMVERDAVRFA